MNIDALVSVIICTRNRSELVRRAIDSTLGQRDVQLEVIVVDDCSEDGTPELLEQAYGDQIRLVRLDRNRRVAFATNRGFEQASGDYIALLGDDDYWTDASKITRQLAAFDSGPTDLGVIGTWWTESDGQGSLVSREPAEPEDWAARLLAGGGVICGSTPLIKRRAWVDAGGLDERMMRGTDSDLFRRIVLRGYEAAIIPVNTTIVDVGHGQVRMTSRRGLTEARKKLFSQAYLLWKYRRYYLRYPEALWSRSLRLVRAPLRTLWNR